MSSSLQFVRIFGGQIAWVGALAASHACNKPQPDTIAKGTQVKADASTQVGCRKDTRVAAWKVPMVLHAGGLELRITHSQIPGADGPGDHAPVSGVNALTVELAADPAAPQGAGIDKVSGLNLSASMPDHGHPASSFVGKRQGGSWTFEAIDLFMPGVWRLDFTPQGPQPPLPTATVTLCVEG